MPIDASVRFLVSLYVVSDILYNSSAPIPNASSYRSLFQTPLLSIFSSLHRAHTHPDVGRITANLMRDKIESVLRAWQQWALFPANCIEQFKHTFQHGGGEETNTMNKQ